MAATQYIYSRDGFDDLLKFKASFRLGKKGDFEHDMVVGAR